MDKDYLQNIAESPYVEEGTFDRALARGTEFGQRTLAEVGTPTKEPSAAIIQTKFRNFTDELKSLLRPFSEGPDSVINKLKRLTPPMTSAETNTANQLVNLYNILSKRGVFPPNIDPQTKNAVAPGILNIPPWSRERSPKKPGLMESLLTEGHRENFKVNRVLATNNATQIVNTYAKAVKDIYYRFLAVIRASVRNLQTNNVAAQSVKTNLTDPRDVAAFDKVESISKSVVSAKAPPVVPPPGVPPTNTPQSSSAQPNTGSNSVPNDFVALVGAAVQLLWQRIKSDKLSAHYYSKPLADGGYYLPKSWEEPHVTEPDEWNATSSINGGAYYVPSGTDANGKPTGYTYVQQTPTPLPSVSEETTPVTPTPEDSTEDDAETIRRKATAQSQEDIDLTGEFVYDFASLYHKYPGKYSIEVTDKPYLVTLPSGKEKVLRVYWEWNKHENTISIEVRNPEESKWEKADILRFYDDQVNPRVPGYNPSFSLFMKQLDRRMESVYKKATNKVEVTKHLNNLKPALYAIIRRKGPMEFVSKTKDELGLVIPPNSNGEVRITRGKEINRTLGVNDIMARYHSTDAKEQALWRNALKDVGYFEKFPLLKEKFDKVEKTIDDAINKYRISHPTVDKESAVLIIKTTAKKLGIALADMTADDLFNKAMEEQAKNPEAIMAKEILVKQGWKPKDAEYYVDQAMVQLGGQSAAEAYMRKAKELLASAPKELLALEKVQLAIQGLIELDYSPETSKKAILNAIQTMGLDPDQASVEDMIKAAFKVSGGNPPDEPSVTKEHRVKLNEGFINPFQRANFL